MLYVLKNNGHLAIAQAGVYIEPITHHLHNSIFMWHWDVFYNKTQKQDRVPAQKAYNLKGIREYKNRTFYL